MDESASGGGLVEGGGRRASKTGVAGRPIRSLASRGHVGRESVVVFTRGRDTGETREGDCRE